MGSNSIFCKGCKHWVHKKCNGLKRLTEDLDYRCTQCQGTARPLDGRPQREVQVGPDKLEVVASFCYLGDMLSAAGGCELSTTTRVKTAWKKFKELKPVLSSFPPPFFQDTWPCVQLVYAAWLAKRREILIFPRTAGNTGNSRELLVIPGNYWEICFSPTKKV